MPSRIGMCLGLAVLVTAIGAVPAAAPSAPAPFTRDALDAGILLDGPSFAAWQLRHPEVAGSPQEPIGSRTPPPQVRGDAVDGTWIRLVELLPALYEHAVVYDPVRDRILLFGGGTDTGWTNEVWAMERSPALHWRRLAITGGPPEARYRNSLVYDPEGDRVLLFGGARRQGRRTLVFDDCWELTLGGVPRWSRIAATGPPPGGRYDHTAILDPVRQRMLVFGGNGDSQGFLPRNDVFALSLTGAPTWTQLVPGGAAPSPRLGHAAGYDPSGDRMLVVGGYDGAFRGDLWALALGAPAWLALSPSDSLSPRAWHAAVVDGPRNRLLVHGGRSAYDVHGGFWSYDLAAGAWQLLAADDGGLGRRVGHAMAIDAMNSRLFVIGGGEAIHDSRTIEFALQPLAALRTVQFPTLTSGASLVYDPVRDRGLFFGGGYPISIPGRPDRFLNDVWSLEASDSSAVWRLLDTVGEPPPARNYHAAAYDSRRDRMIVFGGLTASGAVDDTWELALGGPPTWRRLAPLGGPPLARSRHVMFYDVPRDRLIVHGGTSVSIHDTWVLDLAGTPTWTQLPPLADWPRLEHVRSFVYDPAGERLLLFAIPQGSSAGWFYEFVLGQGPFYEWRRRAPLASGNGPFDGVYDPIRNRYLVSRNWRGPTHIVTLDAAPTITSMVNVGEPPPYAEMNMVFDSTRDRVLVAATDVWALTLAPTAHDLSGPAPAAPELDVPASTAKIPAALAAALLEPLADLPKSTRSIADFVASDGRFDLDAAQRAGFDGGLAATGWALRIDRPDQAPWFERQATDDAWAPGFGFNSGVLVSPYVFAIHDGRLIVAGKQEIHAWDGSGWVKFPELPYRLQPRAMTVFEGDLIVAAQVTGTGGSTRGAVYRWDGSAWRPVGGYFDGGRGDGRVNALAVYGPWLILGGSFDFEGGAGPNILSSRIAVWGGELGDNRWYPLPAVGNPAGGSGGTNGEIFTLGVHAGQLVVGGSFTQAGNANSGIVRVRSIASWCCGRWATYGDDSGVNSWVVSLATAPDGALLAGGPFSHAGRPGAAEPAAGLARWDGTAWSGLGNGVAHSDRRVAWVHALATYAGSVYAGGDFDRAGAVEANYIARWNGTDWEGLGGTDGVVSAMTTYMGQLGASGAFRSAGGLATGGVAFWSGQQWLRMGNGLGGVVYTLAMHAGSLYAGGTFSHTGNYAVPLTRVTRWNGNSWETVGAGLGWEVHALHSFGGRLLAAGLIQHSGTTALQPVAAWDGITWSSVGQLAFESGAHRVRALATYRDTLVAAGTFRRANGQRAWGVVRWDGAVWAPLGTGNGFEPDSVSALLVVGDTLYAAGARGVYALHATTWQRRGDATERPVLALAHHAGRLVAGGRFVYVGTRLVNGLMQWDGSAWQRMGSMGAEVRAFVHLGETLIAGAEVDPTEEFGLGIASWDGTAWVPLGSGVSPPGWQGGVHAFQVIGNDLWVGGGFRRAGDRFSDSVALWRGHVPTPVGPPRVPGDDPNYLRLQPNVPNPFNPVTVVQFEIRAAQRTRVSVFDVSGRLVATLHDGPLASGPHALRWNGLSDTGRPVASGVYICDVATEKARATRKMLLLR